MDTNEAPAITGAGADKPEQQISGGQIVARMLKQDSSEHIFG